MSKGDSIIIFLFLGIIIPIAIVLSYNTTNSIKKQFIKGVNYHKATATLEEFLDEVIEEKHNLYVIKIPNRLRENQIAFSIILTIASLIVIIITTIIEIDENTYISLSLTSGIYLGLAIAYWIQYFIEEENLKFIASIKEAANNNRIEYFINECRRECEAKDKKTDGSD